MSGDIEDSVNTGTVQQIDMLQIRIATQAPDKGSTAWAQCVGTASSEFGVRSPELEALADEVFSVQNLYLKKETRVRIQDDYRQPRKQNTAQRFQTQRRRRCIIQQARDEGKMEKDTGFGRGRVSVTVQVGFLRAQALGISNSSTNPREAAFYGNANSATLRDSSHPSRASEVEVKVEVVVNEKAIGPRSGHTASFLITPHIHSSCTRQPGSGLGKLRDSPNSGHAQDSATSTITARLAHKHQVRLAHPPRLILPHLAGSTSDLSLAGTVNAALSQSVTAASALASSKSKGKGDGRSKTSFLDKAARYLLDGDAAPDPSTADIWLMGLKLPGWGPEDEARIGGGDVYVHFTSSLDVGEAPPALVLHFRPRCAAGPGAVARLFPRAAVVRVPCGIRADPRAASPPSRRPYRALPLRLPFSQAGTLAEPERLVLVHGALLAHAHVVRALVDELAAVAFDQHERDKSEEMVGARREEGVDERHGVGVHVKDGAEFACDEFEGQWDFFYSFFGGFVLPVSLARARLRASASCIPLARNAAGGFASHSVSGYRTAEKDVGMWFGSSAAAGVVSISSIPARTFSIHIFVAPPSPPSTMLVDAFPACGMGVSVATDGTLYQTEVFAASHSPAALSALKVHTSAHGHGTGRPPPSLPPGMDQCTPHRTATDTGRRGSTRAITRSVGAEAVYGQRTRPPSTDLGVHARGSCAIYGTESEVFGDKRPGRSRLSVALSADDFSALYPTQMWQYISRIIEPGTESTLGDRCRAIMDGVTIRRGLEDAAGATHLLDAVLRAEEWSTLRAFEVKMEKLRIEKGGILGIVQA
ncbi:hypothetical protein DFH09DRAFT_1435743 [Mycena vulgaris]|nr:hypothetical protein DFH09DRAFT_1435743 [Mycena vulgaris]